MAGAAQGLGSTETPASGVTLTKWLERVRPQNRPAGLRWLDHTPCLLWGGGGVERGAGEGVTGSVTFLPPSGMAPSNQLLSLLFYPKEFELEISPVVLPPQPRHLALRQY